jgi:hypothetical protein
VFGTRNGITERKMFGGLAFLYRGRMCCGIVREYVQRKVQEIYEPTSPEALGREGIDVALGPAAFENARTLRVGARSVVGRRILVCTGATPLMPAIAGLEETPHCTYHNIFDKSHLPASLTIVGGGPLGMELAQAFSASGQPSHDSRVSTPAMLTIQTREAFSSASSTAKACSGSAVARWP